MRKIIFISVLFLSLVSFGQETATKTETKFSDLAYSNVLEKKGWMYEHMSKYEKALEYYTKALAINPSSDDLPGKIARVQQKIKDDITKDKDPPEIQLLTPKVTRSQTVEADDVGEDKIFVSGTASDVSGISWVSVNGVNAPAIKVGGYFSVNVPSSTLKLVIQASDMRGNIGTETYTIESSSKASAVSNTTTDKIPPITISDNPSFHAVLIACSDYHGGGWSPLPTTIPEARQMKQILVSKYGFDSTHILELYNKDYVGILSALSLKLESMKENDNLVIYFAGHGTYKEKGTELVGYWVPLNATNIDVDYISSKKLNELIAGCKVKHILMLSDACYSGAMRSNDEVKTPSKWEYKLRSRQILTSGGLEKVPGESVFVKMVMEALKKNEDPYLPVSELYSIIYGGIKKQADTEPKLNDFGKDGNEGGQFYFIKKN